MKTIQGLIFCPSILRVIRSIPFASSIIAARIFHALDPLLTQQTLKDTSICGTTGGLRWFEFALPEIKCYDSRTGNRCECWCSCPRSGTALTHRSPSLCSSAQEILVRRYIADLTVPPVHKWHRSGKDFDGHRQSPERHTRHRGSREGRNKRNWRWSVNRRRCFDKETRSRSPVACSWRRHWASLLKGSPPF